MEASVTDVERVLGQIRGSVIDYGEETAEGLHLKLSDGRLVVFTGEFVVAICAKKRTLN